MKKSIFRILVALFTAAIVVAALSACSDPTDQLTYTDLNVTKNGGVVTEISFTEGQRIDYSQYLLLVSVSDDSTFTAPLEESSFDPKALQELYALSGGMTKNMTIRYQNEGKSVQGMINVSVLKPQVEVVTYTLNYRLERDYASYRFDSVSGLTAIASLPETHPDLPIYLRIEWYRDLSDLATKIEPPYKMSSDMTIYGKVVDSRSYTVRFWKDKVGDTYQNQIGTDVSNVKYADTVTVPTENIDKVGFDFQTWEIDGSELSLTGTVGNKYFYIRDVAGEYLSYPDVQIINVCAVYSVKKYTVSFGYLDENGEARTFDAETPYGSSYKVRHGGALSIGGSFTANDAAIEISAPPLALGAGYKGAWYINSVVFGENQTRTVQENIYIYAKYEKLKCGVVFRKYDGTELKSIQVDYGASLTEADYPAHSSETGYEFSWAGADFDLNGPIVQNVVVNEVRTPLIYGYEFYRGDSAAQNLLYRGECEYNGTFSLWDDEQIRQALGADYKSYYQYGWYRSETADASVEAPLIGAQTQSAGTMKFYLKYKDLRRYTVNFYTQQGETGMVSAEPQMTVTVEYAMRASFDASQDPIVGWKTSALYRKDTGELIAADVSFVPSDRFAGGESTLYTIDVVVRYERETYALELYEPIFDGSGNRLIETVKGIAFETSLASLSALTSYATADRTETVNGIAETFRFYGWADESGALIDLQQATMKSATKLYAKWIALSEGTFGIEYTLRDATDGTKYAEVTGYRGSASEFIIGSKYITGGVVYPVTAVGIIVSEGKNITVEKVTIPSGVTRIAPSAFIDFFNVSAFEAAAASESYQTIDGVLYSKDGTKLVAFPRKKTGEFIVPAAVTSIAESAFLGYSNASVTFAQDSGLTRLGRDSFANAEGLISITLPNGLISIASGAFSGCVNLTNVAYTGTTLQNVGVGAFAGTPFYDNAADGALTLGTVLLRVVGTIASDYVLDDAVTAIADGAFESSTVSTFTVGINSKLTYVGGGAFQNCPNLTSFTIEKTDALVDFDLNNYAFQGISYVGFAVYVPTAKLSEYEAKYRNTEYSGDFAVKNIA